jgi:perosamine synthetase
MGAVNAVATIPVAGPWITEHEIAAVTDACANGWFENANAFHDRFETAFAARVGRAHAQALPSCTSAIHLALAAVGVGPGDEVIVPESTWIATVAPVVQLGAKTVFVDVDAASWCIDVDGVERAMTARTKAVIAVDLYGSVGELHALEALCGSREVVLIEDAAEAIGSSWRGRAAGAFGDVSVFSFHGSKTLTTGEGGMAVTDNENLAARMRFLADHGRVPGDTTFRNAEVAYKYKMSALQAALGLAQLDRLDELVGRKREIFGWYHDRLAAVPGITLNAQRAGLVNSYWMTTVVVEASLGVARRTIDKQAVAGALRAAGIATRPFFDPLSSLPAFAGHPNALHAARLRPTSYRVAVSGINLPSALTLTRADIDRVCDTLVVALTGESA